MFQILLNFPAWLAYKEIPVDFIVAFYVLQAVSIMSEM